MQNKVIFTKIHVSTVFFAVVSAAVIDPHLQRFDPFSAIKH